MNWKNIKTQIGLGDEGTFFLHFTDDGGEECYLTIDRPCHVLAIKPGTPNRYGDDVTPDEAFKMLTGRDAAELRLSLGYEPHPVNCSEKP